MGVINISAQHASKMDVPYSILKLSVLLKTINNKLILPGRKKVNHLVPHHGLTQDTGM